MPTRRRGFSASAAYIIDFHRLLYEGINDVIPYYGVIPCYGPGVIRVMVLTRGMVLTHVMVFTHVMLLTLGV